MYNVTFMMSSIISTIISTLCACGSFWPSYGNCYHDHAHDK